MNMIDNDLVQITKDRIADKWTSGELCELLDIPVEDLIEMFWDDLVDKLDLFEE